MRLVLHLRISRGALRRKLLLSAVHQGPSCQGRVRERWHRLGCGAQQDSVSAIRIVQCPSTRLAPDADVFASWQLCWLNWTPVSLFISFSREIEIPDCDLNVSCFQQPVGTTLFSSHFWKARVQGSGLPRRIQSVLQPVQIDAGRSMGFKLGCFFFPFLL